MSDDNIIDFGKKLEANKSTNAESIEDRVAQCFMNGDCECVYCNYRENSAKMVVDFLSRDMHNFENNCGTQVCTFDLKDIFFKAIMLIKDMEKEPRGE